METLVSGVIWLRERRVGKLRTEAIVGGGEGNNSWSSLASTFVIVVEGGAGTDVHQSGLFVESETVVALVTAATHLAQQDQIAVAKLAQVLLVAKISTLLVLYRHALSIGQVEHECVAADLANSTNEE